MIWFIFLYLLYFRFFCCGGRNLEEKKCHFPPFCDTGDNSHPCKCGAEGWVFQFLHIV